MLFHRLKKVSPFDADYGYDKENLYFLVLWQKIFKSP